MKQKEIKELMAIMKSWENGVFNEHEYKKAMEILRRAIKRIQKAKMSINKNKAKAFVDYFVKQAFDNRHTAYRNVSDKERVRKLGEHLINISEKWF